MLLLFLLQGAHYYYEGEKFAHGRESALTYLKENPDFAARIAQGVRLRLAEGADSASRASSDALTASDEEEDLLLLDQEDEFDESS